MINREKLCLQWNDFKENLSFSFGELREPRDFADVTLACEDGKQVEAHKVIFASFDQYLFRFCGFKKFCGLENDLERCGAGSSPGAAIAVGPTTTRAGKAMTWPRLPLRINYKFKYKYRKSHKYISYHKHKYI